MKIESRNNLDIAFKLILFCSLTYFPFFLHLGILPIRLWDESRLAINSYEMSKNGNYLVTFFQGSPDMWNTKPPLLIWLQVFFSKLFGAGELSIRLPSAIAAFLTTAALVFFSIKYLKDYWFGMIAALVLITSYGYVEVHASRTGDYDALLTLFTTLYSLFFFLYLEYKNYKYLHLFFMTLVLTVLTKSIQGLIFLPALFIYMILYKKIMLLKNKWFFIDFFLFIVFVGGYYLLREYYNPGFLQAVWENELGGRYYSALEGHRADNLYYYNLLVNHHYAIWYWLIPCGIAIGLCSKEEKIRKITLYNSLLLLFYLIIISIAQTKLEWYAVPLFPFLASINAIALYVVFDYFRKSTGIATYFKFNIIPFVFLFAVFVSPYEKIINKVYFPKEYDWDKNFYEISVYLKDALKSKHSVQNHFLCYAGNNTQLLFYVNLLNDKKQNVNFIDWKNLKDGDLIIASQTNVQEDIEKNYSFELTENFQGIKKYKIHGKKEHG